MYLKTQPPDTRKNGFGSSDAKRRDEFSNDVEVNKWRERIKNEMEFVSRFASQHAGDEEEAPSVVDELRKLGERLGAIEVQLAGREPQLGRAQSGII